MKPTHVGYTEARPELPERNAPAYNLKISTNRELHDALKVVIELGRFRPVRVVKFIAQINAYLQPCTATIFKYGDPLCLYTPLLGTHVVDVKTPVIDNVSVPEAV